MTTGEVVILLAGAVVAGFVQGVSGFAFSMVAMSIWVWGLEPRVAAVMAVFGAMTGQWLSALTLRRGLRIDKLWPLLAGAAVGLPLGVWAVPQIPARGFVLLMGAVLVLTCPLMLALPKLPTFKRGGRWADALAGLGGGMLAALGGFSGVIPSLWTTLRGWDKDTQRAVMQNFNVAALTCTMFAYIATGLVTREMLPMMAMVAPALIIPSLLGTRVYVGLSADSFRRIVLWLLTVAGITMLATGLRG